MTSRFLVMRRSGVRLPKAAPFLQVRRLPYLSVQVTERICGLLVASTDGGLVLDSAVGVDRPCGHPVDRGLPPAVCPGERRSGLPGRGMNGTGVEDGEHDGLDLAGRPMGRRGTPRSVQGPQSVLVRGRTDPKGSTGATRFTRSEPMARVLPAGGIGRTAQRAGRGKATAGRPDRDRSAV